MSEGDPLFDRVVELCGFSAYVGPGAVRRALAEAGYEGSNASPDDYMACLPALKRRLKVYLPEAEATARVEEIGRFLSSPEAGRLLPRQAPVYSDDETEWGKRRFGNSVAILKQARDGIDPADDGPT